VLVAVAPKAEVDFGTSLLFASPRAKSIRLVDASVTIASIPTGGQRDSRRRPAVATIAPVHAAQPAMPQQARQPRRPGRPEPAAAGQPTQQPPSSISLQALAERGVASNFTALLAGSIVSADRSTTTSEGRLDGQALTEIGITNGGLTIDDRRNGQEWKFQISLWLNRPRQGGAVFTCGQANNGHGC
jgi:hypothetical protein